MRQRTKLPVPNPSAKSEWENFDRLIRFLLSKKPAWKPKEQQRVKDKG